MKQGYQPVKTNQKAIPPKTGSHVQKSEEAETNYVHFKGIILKLAAKASLCFECPARNYCERSPDSSGTNECEESWKKWAFMPYEKA